MRRETGMGSPPAPREWFGACRRHRRSPSSSVLPIQATTPLALYLGVFSKRPGRSGRRDPGLADCHVVRTVRLPASAVHRTAMLPGEVSPRREMESRRCVSCFQIVRQAPGTLAANHWLYLWIPRLPAWLSSHAASASPERMGADRVLRGFWHVRVIGMLRRVSPARDSV